MINTSKGYIKEIYYKVQLESLDNLVNLMYKTLQS